MQSGLLYFEGEQEEMGCLFQTVDIEDPKKN